MVKDPRSKTPGSRGAAKSQAYPTRGLRPSQAASEQTKAMFKAKVKY